MTDRKVGSDEQFQGEIETFRTLIRRIRSRDERIGSFQPDVSKSSLLDGIDVSGLSLSDRFKESLEKLPDVVDVRVLALNGVCGLSTEYEEKGMRKGIHIRDFPGPSDSSSIFYNLSSSDEARLANQMLENLDRIVLDRIKAHRFLFSI